MCDELKSATFSKKRKTDDVKSTKQSTKKSKSSRGKNEKKRKVTSSVTSQEGENDTDTVSIIKTLKSSTKKRKLKEDFIVNEDLDVPNEMLNLDSVEDAPDNADYDCNFSKKKIDPFVNLMEKKRDLFTSVIDEISLEGLDGITLEALWLRLSVALEDALNRKLQLCAWNIILYGSKTNCFRFYELPKARPKLEIYDRFQHINPISGLIYDPPEVPEDVYPYKPIHDQENDIIGSCMLHNERTDVTLQVKSLTLDEVIPKFGNKLVIVANQKLRNLSLFDEYASNIKLTEQEYCLLERIGRSRRLGEVTTGKLSMQTLCKDPKTLFYYRKVLIKLKLIQKQPLNLKINNQNAIGGLYHLPRFYNEFKTHKQLIIEQIIHMLKKREKFRMEYAEVRCIYEKVWDKLNVQKILKSTEARQHMQSKLLLYREVYPDALESEYKRKCTDERCIRVLELNDPYININTLWKDEEQKDDTSDEDTSDTISITSPLSHQCYKILLEAGRKGMSVRELQAKTGLDFYTTRAIIINLNRSNIVDSYIVDCGRQRMVKYFTQSSSHPEFYQKQLEEAKETNNKFEKCDEETLDFIAATLSVDKAHLRKEPQIENAKIELPEGAKIYNYIAESRKKFKKKSDIFMQEDGNSLQDVYKNEHGYIEINQSNNYFQRIPLQDNMTGNKDFKKICFEIINDDSADIKVSCNPFYQETVIQQTDVKVFEKPKFTQVLQRFEDNKTLMDSILKMCLINNVKHEEDFKTVIERANSYLNELTMVDQNATSIEFKYPHDLCSEDEEEYEEDSLIAEMGSFSDYEIRKPQKNSDATVILIDKFENLDACKEEPGECCTASVDEKLDAVGTSENRKILLRAVVANAASECMDVIVEEPENSYVEKIEDIQPVAENRVQEPKHVKEEPQIGEGSSTNPILTKIKDTKNINTFTPDPRLGPKPFLIEDYTDKNGIEIKIYESSKPQDINCNYGETERQLRFKRRVKLIREFLNSEKFTTDLSLIHKHIVKMESNEGSVYKLDRRSLFRVLMYLMKEDTIKIHKICAICNNITRYKYICHLKDFNVSDIIASTVDQMTISFSGNIAKSWDTPRRKIPYKMVRVITKSYGYLAKFSRLRILYEYLYYLIYDYKKRDDVINVEDVPQYIKNKYDVEIKDPEFLKELSPIYRQNLDWKLFLPPLPENDSSGLVLVSDILAFIPLSVYVKIFYISFYIPELMSYLNHPVRKHVLVKNLPIRLRDAFFFKRKYLFAMHQMLSYLCYMGLLQFGAQILRQKDQIRIYLNRKALLYDTMSSDPSYHKITPKEYPQIRFYFNSIENVHDYWMKLCNIAIHTKLGRKIPQLGTYITIENIFTKHDMINASKPVTFDEAVAKDVGYIPGDHAGAACLDSACWVHVKKNWGWTRQTQNRENQVNNPKTFGARKKHLEKLNNKSLKAKEMLKKRRQVNVTGVNAKVATKKSKKAVTKPATIIRKGNKKAKIVRQIIHNTRKKKVLYYDEVDKLLKNRYGKAKAVWSQEEDIALLLCYNVFNYLCVYVQRKFLAYTAIRDVLHILLPDKSMKLSRAYQRRLKKIRTTHNKAELYSSSTIQLSDIYDIHKYFKNFRLKLKTREYGEKQLNIAFLYAINMAYNYLKHHSKSEKYESGSYERMLSSQTVGKLELNNYDDVREKILYKEPSAEDDITDAVIKSLILNTLNSNISNVIINLFNTYQKFPESLLKSALNWLKNKQLIVTNKSRQERKGLQVTGKVYDLSLNYFQKQITQLPHSIFDEVQGYCLGIAEKVNELQSGESSSNTEHYVDLSLEKFEQGHGIAMNEHYIKCELQFQFKLADEVLRMNPNVTDYANLVNELVKRYIRIMYKEIAHDKHMSKLIPTEIKGSDSDIRDYIQNIIVESLKTNEQTISDVTRKKKWKLTDLASLLSKGLFPDLDDERKLEELNNCFTVVHPTPTLQVTQKTFSYPPNSGYKDVLEDIRRDCHIQTREIDRDRIRLMFRENGANDDDLLIVDNIVNFIRNCNHFGTTSEILKLNYSNAGTNVDLLKVIQILLELKVIFKMGVTKNYFVHYEFITPWTLSTESTINNSDMPVRTKVTPWVGFDGTINDNILQNWLKVILTHCITFSSIKLDSLFSRFNYLKPVEIFAIVQFLNKLDCLELYKYEDVEQVTLFSYYNPPKFLEGKVTILDEFDSIYIETRPTAVTTLSNVFRNYNETKNVVNKTPFD